MSSEVAHEKATGQLLYRINEHEGTAYVVTFGPRFAHVPSETFRGYQADVRAKLLAYATVLGVPNYVTVSAY